jgi:hypothetical protein
MSLSENSSSLMSLGAMSHEATSLDETDNRDCCGENGFKGKRTLHHFEGGNKYEYDDKGSIVLNWRNKGPYFKAATAELTLDKLLERESNTYRKFLELEHASSRKLAQSVSVRQNKKAIQANTSHASCEHLYSQKCDAAECLALWRPNRRTNNHKKPGKKKTSEKFRAHNKLCKIRQRFVWQERDGKDPSETANFTDDYDVYSDDDSDDEYYYELCDIYSDSDSDNAWPVRWLNGSYPIW